MMPVLKLAFGGAALWSVMLIAVTERDPPRPEAPIPDPVALRWLPEPAPAPKADRLPARPVLPHSEFAADQEPPALSAADGPPPATAQPAAEPADRRHAGASICARHGMTKQITRGGKSWHCRRPA